MSADTTDLRAVPADIASGGRRTDPWRPSERAEGAPLGALAFVCVGAAVPLVTLNAIRLTYSVSVGDFLLVIGGALAVAPRIRRGFLAGSLPPWLLGGGTGLLIAALLAAFRGSVARDLVPAFEFAGTMVIMPLVVMLAVDSYRRLEFVVEAWLFAVSLSAVVGVADLKLGTGIGYHLIGVDYVGVTNRATGLTLQPNFLGLTAAMAMPVAALRASCRVNATGFAVANARNLLYLVLLGVGVLVSGSRSGLAAAAAGVVLLPLFQSRRRRSVALTATAVGIVLVLAVLTLDSSVASKLGIVTASRLTGQAAGTSASDQARLDSYHTAIHDVLTNPVVGQGFQSVRVAHDIYLQLLQAGGLIALGAFLWFALGMVLACRGLADRADLPPPVAGLASAFGASFCAWLINGLVTNGLYDRYLYIPTSLLLAARLIAGERAARANVPDLEAVEAGLRPSWPDP